MRNAMNRLAAVLGRRRRWVVAAWVAIVVCALPVAKQQTDHLTGGGFDVPGSQSLAASEALQRDFGSQADGILVALKATPDTNRADRAAAVGRVRREVAALDEVTLSPSAAAAGRRRLQRTGFALLPLRSQQSSAEPIGPATTLRDGLDPGGREAGVTPYLVGQPTIWAGMQEISKRDLSRAEGTGFPIVALILLIVFGSLAAAALPPALGFVRGPVTGPLHYFLSLYREEREAGGDQGEARAEALSTSGLAVSFSGLAVIISLAGLWMVDNQALRSMALGAMTVVAVSILTATTLLPALIAMLGDRVLPGGIVGRGERFLKHRVLRRPGPGPTAARA